MHLGILDFGVDTHGVQFITLNATLELNIQQLAAATRSRPHLLYLTPPRPATRKQHQEGKSDDERKCTPTDKCIYSNLCQS